jgi:hypothetical protein
MKINLLIAVFWIVNAVACYGQTQVDSLLHLLDGRIRDNAQFLRQKEQRIQGLKMQRHAFIKTADKGYSFNFALFNEYKNYVSDSAIHYINLNRTIAEELMDENKWNESTIALGNLFVGLGMYMEASELLKAVKADELRDELSVPYAIAYRELYLGMGKYTQHTAARSSYWAQANRFNDSVRDLTPAESEEHLRIVEKKFRLNKQYREALKINDRRLQLTSPDKPAYALVTFHRSLIYRELGDITHEKKYLALSALSDIQLAIRDNASISVLANLLMQEGDINRAYQYICFSLENIKAYNTRIRSSEILNIQTIIDSEYQRKNEQKSEQLKGLLLLVSILSVLLIISVLYVYKQLKKGRASARELAAANADLATFNSKLHDMNTELASRNLEVAEANHIKEEYIAYFLNECSIYISKLDNYRKMVNKKMQERQYEELARITRDNSLTDEELKELFANFDKMFINLFPDFVDQVNALLSAEEQIVLKRGEVLNTELRIFALIRLGIVDSLKIANFFGYSINTIYNYRTKMKNRSRVAREDFEVKVKKIGAFM